MKNLRSSNIWMVYFLQIPVSFADFFVRSIDINAQDFIIISVVQIIRIRDPSRSLSDNPAAGGGD